MLGRRVNSFYNQRLINYVCSACGRVVKSVSLSLLGKGILALLEYGHLLSEKIYFVRPCLGVFYIQQAVARGFFNYLEKLKYEYHLKESLKQMNVGEDLEKDDLDSRRYKYLDDDGSLSPIEELA